MNVITFSCPECGTSIRVPATDVGCQVACQGCNRHVEVPKRDKGVSLPAFLTRTTIVPVWTLVVSAALILTLAAFLVGRGRSTPEKLIDAAVAIDQPRLVSDLIQNTYFEFTWGPGWDGVGKTSTKASHEPQTIKFEYDGQRLKRVEFTFMLTENDVFEFKTLAKICRATPDEDATMRASLELAEQKHPALGIVFAEELEKLRGYPGRITGQLRIELTVHENQATFTFLPPR
jgi:hypothetical protein